ncbi:MAG TPA: hypothetical protein VMT87_03760 [Vicinamibacteria bacterium]|nr:hypothetical protein [Vicinamibacteria bacterium]
MNRSAGDAPRGTRASALRRPEAALFALAFAGYAYFFQGGGWNAAVRFDLVRAIVEQGTVRIDGYERNTGDLAYRDGHYYCDKAPGLSFAAVPVYAAVYPLAGEGRLRGRFVSRAAWLATALTVALPSAAAVVMLYLLGEVLGLRPAWRALVALAYAFATLAFPYSTLFYGHQLAAALLFCAFGLLMRARWRGALGARRLFAVGALLGAAIAVEYPSALAAAAIVLYAAAFVRPWPRLFWLAAGAFAPLAGLAAYHAVAFGSPLTLPYAFSTDAPRRQGAFFGLGAPSPRVLYAILLSPYRGLFYSAPWLLLALPGAVRLWRAGRFRPEVAVTAALPLLYVLLNAGLNDWHGGWGTGPRHLVPALPFLALAAGGLVAGRAPSRPEAAAYALVAGYSAVLMLVATAVQPEVPRWFGRPFEDYLWPAFAEGRLALNTLPIHTGTVHERREAWNAGELMGLTGIATLAPLAVLLAAGASWLRAVTRQG